MGMPKPACIKHFPFFAQEFTSLVPIKSLVYSSLHPSKKSGEGYKDASDSAAAVRQRLTEHKKICFWLFPKTFLNIPNVSHPTEETLVLTVDMCMMEVWWIHQYERIGSFKSHHPFGKKKPTFICKIQSKKIQHQTERLSTETGSVCVHLADMMELTLGHSRLVWSTLDEETPPDKAQNAMASPFVKPCCVSLTWASLPLPKSTGVTGERKQTYQVPDRKR